MKITEFDWIRLVDCRIEAECGHGNIFRGICGHGSMRQMQKPWQHGNMATVSKTFHTSPAWPRVSWITRSASFKRVVLLSQATTAILQVDSRRVAAVVDFWAVTSRGLSKCREIHIESYRNTISERLWSSVNCLPFLEHPWTTGANWLCSRAQCTDK